MVAFIAGDHHVQTTTAWENESDWPINLRRLYRATFQGKEKQKCSVQLRGPGDCDVWLPLFLVEMSVNPQTQDFSDH